MARRFTPESAESGFRGVDWHADRTHLGIRAFTDLKNMRVDRYDRLRSCHQMGDTTPYVAPAADRITGVWADPILQDYIYAARVGTGTLIYYEGTSIGGALDGTNPSRTYLVPMHARLYAALPGGLTRAGLADIRAGGVTIWSSITRDLTAYPVPSLGENYSPVLVNPAFKGIVSHEGRMFGWGYGDDATGDNPGAVENLSEFAFQTGFLGPDRPELLRWSIVGQPDTWPTQNWIVIGARGRKIVTCLEALGRLFVLKEDGAFIFYRPDGINASHEAVQADDDVPTDCVSPWSATAHDDGVYWMSSAGPMRWRGGLRADPIGYGIKGQWETGYALADTIVVPVPEYEAVAFIFSNAIGGKAFLWDTNRERWAGSFNMSNQYTAATALRDTTTGQYHLLALRAQANQLRTGQLSGRRHANACSATTGATLIAARRGAVPRAVVASGDWSDAGDGEMTARAPKGGPPTACIIRVRATSERCERDPTCT